MELDRFKDMSAVLSSYVKDAVKAPGIEELYLPGEIEFTVEEKRMRSGIPITDGVLDDLNNLSRYLGVPELVGCRQDMVLSWRQSIGKECR
jgi:LDH2 family malate/lactate/ureidoglycolate dehydrogenase